MPYDTWKAIDRKADYQETLHSQAEGFVRRMEETWEGDGYGLAEGEYPEVAVSEAVDFLEDSDRQAWPETYAQIVLE